MKNYRTIAYIYTVEYIGNVDEAHEKLDKYRKSLRGISFLYTLSQNVLLASMMHSVWNNINTFILGDIYRNEATGLIVGNVKVINGEGIFGMIFLIISAFIFYKVLFNKSK